MYYVLLALLSIPLGMLGVLFYFDPKPAKLSGYRHNPRLKNLLPPERWKGTPVDELGRFVNHEFPFLPRAADLLRWQTEVNPQKAEKKADTWRPEVRRDDRFLADGRDVVVWLGHATFFVRIGGVRLLIDPVLGHLAPTVRRLSPFPIDPAKLTGLDYILISHNHRDHCDEDSVRLLAAQNPDAVWLTGLELDTLLAQWTGSTRIQAAGWYQQYETDSRIELYYLPSRHWARRGISDNNTQLWGAFVLKAGGRTVYFSGDTGYGSHLREVGTLFPEPDVCLIGVAAYKPEWFMGPNHISPTNALRAFREMKAKTMIPMHYGTFDLADEPIGDPYRVLSRLRDEGKADGLHIAAIGEPYWLS